MVTSLTGKARWPFSSQKPEAPTENELGGGKSTSVAGVGAGGGGEGAEDFTRPQPESRGKAPGGARIRHRAKGERASDHSRLGVG